LFAGCGNRRANIDAPERIGIAGRKTNQFALNGMNKRVTEIIKDIQKKAVKPLYVFDGDEPFYIDVLCDAFEDHLLDEAEKDFNQTVFYGKDTDWAQVVNACRSYPSFANRRVVILKEAADLKNFNQLEAYFKQPAETTTLVVCYKHKKIDGRSSMIKTIKAHGIHESFMKLKDYELPDWILNYAQGHQMKISASNCDLLAAYLGNDLKKIVNELKKLQINIPQGAEITGELIEKYIGISKEYNVFEFPKSILSRNAEQSFRIARYFMSNPKEHPLVVITAMLYTEFNKLYRFHYTRGMSSQEAASLLKINPYFMKDYTRYAQSFNLKQTAEAIHLIAEYNQAAVGIKSSGNPNTILKELTYKLITL
jgi:DNA polymerase-3 subunit delta